MSVNILIQMIYSSHGDAALFLIALPLCCLLISVGLVFAELAPGTMSFGLVIGNLVITRTLACGRYPAVPTNWLYQGEIEGCQEQGGG